MNKQAQSAVLFLMGAALLHAGTTDLYLRYVKSALRPLLLLAGAVLLLTALATTWYEWRASRRVTGPDDVHREPRISWLLLLPLFALILVAPPALGSYSAVRTGTALQQPYGYGKLPERGVLRLSLVDYAGRAAYDHGRHLTGRTIQITGFVSLDAKGTPYLVRMALNCCAADAQPVKIALTGKIPPVLQPDTWLEVAGTYTPRESRDPINNGRIPYLKVTTAKPVPTPHDPYDESWNQ
ncbi:TIGR03943 family putative permease subunit [Streptomyces sp. YIM S03343]